MEALKKAILELGEGIGHEVVKVDSFLNHRIDTKLSAEMGKEFAERFSDSGAEIVMTCESSGIAVALTTAMALGNIPVVFAKKGATRNVTGDVLTANVYSFTHQQMNTIRVDRKYLPEGSKVLIIDDFLANGEAVRGLMNILLQARCECVGVGICVEKGWQEGGKVMRASSVKYIPLAVVDAIDEGKIVLRND